MKVVVVGLGSMGKRRIRLLRAIRDDIEIVGVDSSKSRRDESETLYGIAAYESLADALENFAADAAFVCTPPLSHAAITIELLEAFIHVFSEINLIEDGYHRSVLLARDRGVVLFLSSTPMYRKEIEYIKNRVQQENGKVSYRYHVGQYLPDWHPWESYNDFFVGDRHTSGIRELFAIELPWIVNTFGDVKHCVSKSNRLANLNIGYDDSYAVTLEHDSGIIGQLTVDVVSRKAIRELLVWGENIFLRWGGTNDSLMDYDILSKEDRYIRCYDDVLQDERYAKNIIENAYIAEIEDFLGLIEGYDIKPRHNFIADLRILEIIDSIEESQ